MDIPYNYWQILSLVFYFTNPKCIEINFINLIHNAKTNQIHTRNQINRPTDKKKTFCAKIVVHIERIKLIFRSVQTRNVSYNGEQFSSQRKTDTPTITERASDKHNSARQTFKWNWKEIIIILTQPTKIYLKMLTFSGSGCSHSLLYTYNT